MASIFRGRPSLLASAFTLALFAQTACSGSSQEHEGDSLVGGSGGGAPVGSGGHTSASGGTSSGGPVLLPGGDGNSPTTEVPVAIVDTLPEGFSPADALRPATGKGGFKVLGPLAEVAASEGECANILRVIVRDFEAAHDDFENADDWDEYEVQSPIGETRKPQKTSEGGPLHLDEWYQNLEGVNLPFAVDLWLEPVGQTFVYDSTAFFPLRDVGFMDSYFFTTELHTKFEYKGGEVFTFRGDDDVFVYINGHLAVNLSGIHEAQEGSVSLDERAATFGLEIGNVYTFDLFQAERQTSGSNFRLETTLDFTGCGEILPGDIIR